jgi:hypothetical protein
MLPTLLALLIASTKFAAPPADLTRAALARQFAQGARRCTQGELSTAIANARIKRIGTLAGDPVVLAMLYGQCLSGAANGPWLIIRVSATATKPLLSTIAQNVDVLRSNDALPRIREQMHGSAYVSRVTIDVFRAGRYVAIDSYEMRNETRERYPRTINVSFAPGASSAQITGKLWPQWGQTYEFYGSQGQHIEVGGISGKGGIWMYLSPTADGQTVIKPGVPQTLDRGGAFRLWVSSSSEHDVRYAFKLIIR